MASLPPERLDAFMARANAAYYASHDPFADFTTAPEISQVFGEILGLWAAVVWQAMGAPDPVILAEAGPGRGTLMADALRAAQRVPAFRAALRLHLVETSPRLRAVQAERLPQPVFHDRVEALPDGPLLLLANEFLDALPIRQMLCHGGGCSEHFVQAGRLVAVPPAEGAYVVQEICEPARALAGHLGARLAAQGGAALFLDYGPAESAPGDSLQALREGRPADPLAEPGAADLTAHVDFQAFGEAARAAGGAVQGAVPQGVFLTRLGLFQRSGMLARTLPPARGQAMIAAAQRLAEPDRMGRLFKAMAVCDPALPPLPGFGP
jgi:SAM-dependent MidA family methyltransferase